MSFVDLHVSLKRTNQPNRLVSHSKETTLVVSFFMMLNRTNQPNGLMGHWKETMLSVSFYIILTVLLTVFLLSTTHIKTSRKYDYPLNIELKL